MSVTIPLLTTIPSSSAMTEAEYNSSWNTLLSELDPYATAANTLAAEVEVHASDAEAAVASLASAKWVSGTYAEGAVAWSPTDYLNYRCKNTGSRTTDPAADPTNWALLTKTGAGGSDTTSSAVDITLTYTSGRLQIISMTAPAKKTTLPNANLLQKGASIFVFHNIGTYRFSVHKSGNEFICYVNPGDVIAVNCSDISSAAGVWEVSGQNIDRIYGDNTAEVLNAVDSRNIAVAMLSATKAICVFRNNVTGFLWGVILNYGTSSGSPSQINGVASSDISIAEQTSTQATVVFKIASGATEGYVLDVSANTITPGTIAHIDTTAAGTGTGVAALSSTKLICVYQQASSGTVRERVLDISASVITPSAEVAADATAAQASTRRELVAVSATKALVAFKTNGSAQVTLRLQSITGSTPAPTGSALVILNIGGTNGTTFSLVALSASRAVLIQSPDLTYADLMLSLIDISGTTPVLLTQNKLMLNIINSAYVRATKIDANNIYIAWNGGGSGGADSIIVRITDNDKILSRDLPERIEPGVTAAEAYIDCVALDSTHIMQVCRDANTYLSAKTVVVSGV